MSKTTPKDKHVSKAVAKVEPKQNAVAVNAADDEFAEHAGSGLEHIGARDLIIPRLTILQGLSPQLDKSAPQFIKGAAIGQICDVATNEVFDDEEGIMFLPVLYRMDYLEWAPRSSGKGLVKIHTDARCLDRCVRDDKGKYITPEGNYIQETGQFYGINLTADLRKCFIPMASTQLKKARSWNTMATGEKRTNSAGKVYTPPMWSRTYHLTTAQEQNNDGKWSGWKIERGDDIITYCKENKIDWPELKADVLRFIESLETGQARGDLESVREEGSSSANTSGEERM